MAKWINTATGLVVPSDEVQEMAPGSGIFLHLKTVTQKSLVVGPQERGGPAATYSATAEGPTRVIDGYAVKIGDDETYDPDVHNVQSQVIKAQSSLFTRGGLA